MAHTPAQAAALALARMYLEQGDDKHALRMLRAATLGKSPNVAALVLQVSCFLSPQTVSRQDAPSSIFKQRRDASTDALMNYYHSLVQAQCLMQGRGTPRDARAALGLFRRAAAAGRGIEAGSEAAWELGRLLLDVCARILPPLSLSISRERALVKFCCWSLNQSLKHSQSVFRVTRQPTSRQMPVRGCAG